MILNLFLVVNIFSNDVTQRYNKEDATLEVLIMLGVAALLGFLLRHFMGYISKKEIIIESDNSSGVDGFMQMRDGSEFAALKAENDKLKRDLSSCLDSYQTMKSNSTLDSVSKANKSKVKVAAKPASKAVAKGPKPKLESKKPAAQAIKPTPKAKNTAKKTSAKTAKTDDLKIIEGIGPALEKLLIANGISTYDQLSKESVKNLERILDEAGPRFRVHVPETWAQQAKLLRDGKMNEFSKLTEKLKGGRRV